MQFSQAKKTCQSKKDVVIALLSSVIGDNPEIVLDAFAQIIIDQAYDVPQIKSIIAPMLAPTLRP